MSWTTNSLTSMAILLSVALSVSCQIEMSQNLGKECAKSFHCWRTEPVDVFGMPLSLSNLPEIPALRSKRLEIGSKASSRGGRCRCIEDSCRLFHGPSETFFPCEEF